MFQNELYFYDSTETLNYSTSIEMNNCFQNSHSLTYTGSRLTLQIA